MGKTVKCRQKRLSDYVQYVYTYRYIYTLHLYSNGLLTSTFWPWDDVVESILCHFFLGPGDVIFSYHPDEDHIDSDIDGEQAQHQQRRDRTTTPNRRTRSRSGLPRRDSRTKSRSVERRPHNALGDRRGGYDSVGTDWSLVVGATDWLLPDVTKRNA